MKKNTIIIIGVFLLIIGVFFDSFFTGSIISFRNKILTPIMFLVSFLGSAIAVTVITTAMFIYDKKKREYLPLLWFTLLISFVAGFLLKHIIARPRPNILPIEIKNSFSFPSGHAISVFAPLVLIDREFPKLKWLWLFFAILVLFSRVYLGVHYFSDIIAGALIGYIIALLVLMAAKQV